MKKRLSRITGLTLSTAIVLSLIWALMQNPSLPPTKHKSESLSLVPAPPLTDPSGIWYHAYLNVQKAQQFEQQGDPRAALEHLEVADALYTQLRAEYASYQPELVEFRVKRIEEARLILAAKEK